MNNNFLRSLEYSLQKGFIDKNISGSAKYKPQLLTNNIKESENVLSSLLEELTNCHSFIFSVAFITESGLATLKSYLYDLHLRGIKGRILTSTFLNFNQPKVFKELLKITNVEVRLTNVEGFHSKGYIFEYDQFYSLIVGSSNLTAQALKANYEWNVKLTSYEDGEIIDHFKNQFEEVWEKSIPLNDQWIKKYESLYQPNEMQKSALDQIQKVRDEGNKKGLVISATGTGKTYLSAFDVRKFAPKRMLFIVHREQILQKAKEDYQRLLGGLNKDYGILSG